ncbi:MAG: shikimate dehydrogenase [Hyphomicrobiales bacterium]|nr:shikimate dehydrogenase [Hyphomicrobiales bacterium]
MKRSSPPRAGVAGWPVSHSRSPIIHLHWLKELGLAGTYERFAVPPGEFDQFAAQIGHDGFVGVSVTAPHKQAAFAVCERRTEVARALGAVNTLWREDGRLWGDNTDVAGFLTNMDEGAPSWSSGAKRAVVIGAGGAARAIVYGLLTRGFERVVVINRTGARAQTLAAEFGRRVTHASWGALTGESCDADLLVNTSVLGMTGQPPLRLDLSALPDAAVVADVVYAPLQTELVRAARARGLRAVEGLGMLLHQAAPAFARWFGRRPAVTPALRALVEGDLLAAKKVER